MATETEKPHAMRFMMHKEGRAIDVGPREWFDGQISILESMSSADSLPIGTFTLLRHMAMTIAELYERLEGEAG